MTFSPLPHRTPVNRREPVFACEVRYFSSIGSGFTEPQLAENRHFQLTRGIALTTCYTVMVYDLDSRPNCSAGYMMSHTQEQQHFTIPEVAADWHELQLYYSALQCIHCTVLMQPHYRVKQLL